MAEPPIPLGEQCRRIVMEHMNANKRYLLAACCPALREIHAQVPLKINHLILHTNGFTVDNVPHTLYIYVNSWNQMPLGWEDARSAMGKTYELDDVGFKKVDQPAEGDIEINRWMVQYDLVVGMVRGNMDPQPNEWELEEMESGKQQRERAKNQRLRTARQGRVVRVRTYLEYTYSPETRVRYPRRTKLADAVRKLTTNFFASSEIFVNLLEITVPYGVFRFPRDLRFHVVTLKTDLCSAAVYDTLSRIIIGDPIKKLRVRVKLPRDPILNHDILRTIPCLSISFWSVFNWDDTLTRIDVATLEIEDSYYSADTITHVGKHWIEHPRPVGRKLKFLSDIIYKFEPVQNRLGTTKGTILDGNLPPEYPNCGFKQVNPETVFVIYVQKENRNEVRPTWFIVFEMMKVGSVRALEGEALEEGDA